MKSAPNVKAVGDRRDASVFDLFYNSIVAIIHSHNQSANGNVNGVREQQERRASESTEGKKHQPLMKPARLEEKLQVSQDVYVLRG